MGVCVPPAGHPPKGAKLGDWIPAWARLPDTVEAIEAGRQEQGQLFPPEPLDQSRAGRLARLLGCRGRQSDNRTDGPGFPPPDFPGNSGARAESVAGPVDSGAGKDDTNP